MAAGERLAYHQEDIILKWHAMECRINAEDPEKGFRPTPGKITSFHVPGGHGVRVDTHAYAKYIVPPFYDSLLAKLIAHGKTRGEALIRMERAVLRPLLGTFIKNFDSLWMREGGRHILRVLNDRHKLNDREIILLEELKKQAIPGFESGWNSQQAWAAEKVLEVLDRDAIQAR